MKDKKMIILPIIGVLTMLVMIASATYAYFNVTSNSSITTSLSAKTPDVNIITVSGNNNLHIKLQASDLGKESNREYYATSEEEKNYETTEKEGTYTIATIKATKDLGEQYDCIGKITINLNTEDGSMGAALEEDDMILKIMGGGINEEIDLSELKETNGIKEIVLKYRLNNNEPEEIKAYVKFNNSESKPQNYIGGKKLELTIKVENTSCSLGKSGVELVKEVLGTETVPQGLNTTKVLGGLYRYVGACNAANGQCDGIVDNFVCFGTDTPESDCAGQVDSEYMYRIIGIDPSTGDLKLIKNTSIREESTTGFYWHGSNGSSACEGENCEWPNSDLYKRLNGEESSYSKLFIDATSANAKYLTTGSKWYSMIKDTEWRYGDSNNINTTAEEMYQIETGAKATASGYSGSSYTWEKTIQAKIGLMNVSDYYYSKAGNKSENCYNDYSCKNSWLHISNNGKSGENSYEWTIARYGSNGGGYYYAWFVYSAGNVSDHTLNVSSGVRPVFYLGSEKAKIGSGDGTVGSPYVMIPLI